MMKKWGKALREKEMQIAIEQRKNPETVEISGFSGCGDRTRTCDLRVMRQSQAQIGVISAPICAFCHRSLGEFSIVSVQPCPPQFHSGSKLGQ